MIRFSRALALTTVALLSACGEADEGVRTTSSPSDTSVADTAAGVGQALTDAVRTGNWRAMAALRSSTCASVMSDADIQKWIAADRQASASFEGPWTVRVEEAGDTAQVFADAGFQRGPFLEPTTPGTKPGGTVELKFKLLRVNGSWCRAPR